MSSTIDAAAASEASVVPTVGFTPDEVRTGEPTRSARLKWVVVVAEGLEPGRAVNAAVCVASATARAVEGLLGPDAVDASGSTHPGLPWAGCSVLVAPREHLAAVRAKAARSEGVHVSDMPAAAQSTRVYDEYLAAVGAAEAEELDHLAVSVVGPRERVDEVVGRLPLMP
ncbi:DUF2000 domain-containing protein [uncultured Pseudokineococcus sp.]|uniref:DUF2000 domain-containing protein n=1 Tax=uncultured Pseudokineococcus sp. TaxID=1642928 RepID=UPI00262A2DBE|nr:DUF2000 domain-containing protein [uncultured Pseudokineococcus sp.]